MKKKTVKVPQNLLPSDPNFFMQAFLSAAEDEGPLAFFDLRSEVVLSGLMDVSLLQDSFRYRTQRRSRLFANFLIDELGELRVEVLNSLMSALEKAPYIIFPNGLNDGKIVEHQILILKKLKEDSSFLKTLKRFRKPLCHRAAETLIKDTLGMPHAQPITDAHIMRAVLASCLTVLRQNVGSCFATAPAILILDEQMDSYLQDIYELLSTGKLKRTFGGVEYVVPLSPSWGMGDLKKRIAISENSSPFWVAPGLLAAFDTAGIIDSNLPLEQKANAAKRLIFSEIEKNTVLSVDELIHQLLLKSFDLSDEDLIAYQKMEAAAAASSKYLPPGRDLGRSKKRELAEEMLQIEKEAFAAFKGVCDNAILKAWEFTIASYSESKQEFSRWNLYSSLGFNPEERGGIGELIYRFVQERLDQNNDKVKEYQADYELAYDQLRATEGLLRQASTESEARRLKAEHQTRLYHMQMCLEMRDRSHAHAALYSNFFSFLIKQYDAKFQEYFQEIFDAEMLDVKTEQYDDSPAGFRLVYKHGRSDASLWTLVYNAEQYIDVLVDFFLSTESQIASASDWDLAGREVQEVTTIIVSHVRTKEFLETALVRMAKAHHFIPQSFSDYSKIEKKPWAYTSGGTMTNLIKTYFKRENNITEESRWVENETDLLVFILDVLKSLPPSTTEPFLKSRNKRMLMYSPNHAFVMQPGWEFFSEGWQDSGFTYTWARDRVVAPAQKFYKEIIFDVDEQEYLIEEYMNFLPLLSAHQLRRSFHHLEKVTGVKEFRQKLFSVLIDIVKLTDSQQRQTIADRLDSFLYQMLPLTSGRKWKNNVRRLLSQYVDEQFEAVLDLLPEKTSEIINAKQLKEIAKGVYLIANGSCRSEIDLHRFVAIRAQQLGLSAPSPLLFADTNWPNYYFGFVVSPATNNLELWRMDSTGSEGDPMSSWKPFLDGSKRLSWGLCTRPYEYTF